MPLEYNGHLVDSRSGSTTALENNNTKRNLLLIQSKVRKKIYIILNKPF